MKKIFCAILFMLISIIPLFADPAKKTTAAVIDEGTNYVFHVLAVSRVNFNSDYAYIYKDTVIAEDKDYIYKQKKHLALSDDETGILAKIIINFPAYLNLDTKEKIKEYYLLLEEGFRINSFESFLNKYSQQTESINQWPLNQEPINENYLRSLSGYEEIIRRIGAVYVRNFSVYDKRLWNVENGKMQKSAALINDFLKYANLISKWEMFTGQTFKADAYYILMCRAIEGGPNLISLSYDRSAFYSDAQFSFFNKFISHQVGSHILIDIFADALKSGIYKFGDLYTAYENLVEFYNCQVLKVTYFYNTMCDRYGTDEYMKIYNQIYEQNNNISPKDMLSLGIEAFIKLKMEAKNTVKNQ